MRYWECKCGNFQAFGSMPPEPCSFCKKCGTNAFQQEPEPHDFRIRYSEETGEPVYSMCINCHERRPIPRVPVKTSEDGSDQKP